MARSSFQANAETLRSAIDRLDFKLWSLSNTELFRPKDDSTEDDQQEPDGPRIEEFLTKNLYRHLECTKLDSAKSGRLGSRGELKECRRDLDLWQEKQKPPTERDRLED
ncbi:MAG: hypothetical protein Q9181_001636 [Wetmoreana brouardii]